MIKTFNINKLGSSLSQKTNVLILFGDPQCRAFDDGTTKVRKCIVGDTYVTSITLTETGFNGIENIDWEIISIIPII